MPATLARRWWVIIICCVVAALGALGYSLTQTRQYTASTSLLFTPPMFDNAVTGISTDEEVLDPTRAAATNAELVALPQVSVLTSQALSHRLSAATIRQRIHVAAVGQGDIVAVEATDPSPAFAAQLANTYAREYDAYSTVINREQIQDALNNAESQLADDSANGQSHSSQARRLNREATDLRGLLGIQTSDDEVVQAATAPSSPSSPKVARNGALGALAGLLIGFGLAFLLERLDRRLREPEEMEATFGLPLLGTVPESPAFADRAAEQPLPSGEAEAFRLLQARLRYFNVDREIRSLVVTSGGSSDGKTTVAVNLALAEAAGHRRILLLDANFRRPSVGQRLGLQHAPGISDVLSGTASLEEAIATIELPAGSRADRHASAPPRVLRVLPAGTVPPNPSEMIESHRMAATLRGLTQVYDRVIVDGPPTTVASEVRALVGLVDGIVIVSDASRETRDSAMRLREQLLRLSAPTLGVVANRVTRSAGRVHGSGYDGSTDLIADEPKDPEAAIGEVT